MKKYQLNNRKYKLLIDTYPETKAPVPKRKNKAREAPRISKTLSGLTENAFGFGGLKLGGGENVVVLGGSSLEVTGVSVEDDLMLNELLLMGGLVLALKIGR